MVGSAQYRDDEIGWILAAVVAKKKQDFIKRHFEDRFGRPLNHNQIRYIKNKYGKDPRFNSPLINIRPCAATASSSGSPDSDDSDEIIPIPTIPLPDIVHTRVQNPQNDGQAKRKRVLEDESNEARQIRTQRQLVQHNPIFDCSREGAYLSSVPRWDPVGPRLASSLQSLLPPLATPRASHGHASMYEINQPRMQGIGSLNRAFPKDGPWMFGERSNLIDASSHRSPTASEIVAPSPIELSRSSRQMSTLSALDMPLGGDHSPSQIPRPNPCAAGGLQFSPIMPPIDLASHTFPAVDSLLVSSIKDPSLSPSSMPFRKSNQDALFPSSVAAEVNHRRPLLLHLQMTDDCGSDQARKNQDEVSNFCPISPDRIGPMTSASWEAPSKENAGFSNVQAVFPMQLPTSSHFGIPDFFANYISSPRAPTYSQLPPLTLHHSFPTGSGSSSTPWMFQDVHEGHPAISTAGDSRDIRGFGWQLRDPFRAKTDAQDVGSHVSKPVGQGLVGVESGIFGLPGQELLQEVLMSDAQYTTAPPAEILSPRAATDFAANLGFPLRTQRCEEVLNDELIDPSLLGAFELDGDPFDISLDRVISQTG